MGDRVELASPVACAYCGSYTTRKSGYCCLACEHLADLKVPESLDERAYKHLDQESFKFLYRLNQPEINSKGLEADLPKKVVGFISQHYRLPKPNAPPGDTFEFYVEGLHCTSCIHLLEKLPELSTEILSSRVHFGKSTLTITLAPNASLARAAALIKSLGYEPVPLSAERSAEDLRAKETKQDLLRIGVAGFCAGNMMLFVVPVYGGLSGKLADYFNGISLLLFLPVLLYSAVPFYKGAWASLKYRSVSVDLPITIAIFSGFLMSFINLIRGDDAIYFDSTASFLFFILVARYLLKKSQKSLLARDQARHYYKNQKYLKARPGGQKEVIPWSGVTVGDELVLENGQLVPTEVTLLSPAAHLDMSLFSGESLPRSFTEGMTLYGGSRVIGGPITVKVVKSFKDSQMGRLFQQLESAIATQNRFSNLSDKLAQILILTVLIAAGLFFAYYGSIDKVEAFNRALALIILACPCALAFGTPLAYALSMKQAQSKGILIRSCEALDKLLTVQDVYFDKTGTLTTGELTLTRTVPAQIGATTKSLILGLESISHHPIAYALRRAWATIPVIPLSSVSITQKGLKSVQPDASYEIRELESSVPGEIAVEFLVNDDPVAHLFFSDPVREDSYEIVEELHALGLKTHILSGDRNDNAQKIADDLGVHTAQGDLTPEDKWKVVSSQNRSCMIGDGANDALALKDAHVGIAVQGGVDLALSSAAVTFTRAGLSPLLELFRIAKKNRRTIVRNLTVSFIYNFVGGVLALLGLINPMMAAILMPVSSILIILSTLMGVR